ncbi:hypothetical protein K439DRAFT_1359334 [Ramaria rubella]|nr:hypothetical protein K439DRAFT_1359334 [Ramaria rubella]
MILTFDSLGTQHPRTHKHLLEYLHHEAVDKKQVYTYEDAHMINVSVSHPHTLLLCNFQVTPNQHARSP